MQVSTRAVLTAVLATLVAVGGYLATLSFGELPLAVIVGALAVLFAVGWPMLTDLPSRPGSGAVVALGGAGAVAVVYLTVGEPFLRALPVVFGASIVLTFINELLRSDGRAHLVESVSGTVSGSLIAACAAGWVATQRSPGGAGLVITGALALAVGSAVCALRVPGWAGIGITTGAAVAAGGLGGVLLSGPDPVAGALLGLAVGVLVASIHELFDRLPALSRVPASLAATVLPVPVTGVLVYVVGRVMVG
ncbi:MAG: hypothetical protein ACOH17_15370 [Cellulomonas sp.]